MFLMVPAHPGCTRQNPESHKMDVCVCLPRNIANVVLTNEQVNVATARITAEHRLFNHIHQMAPICTHLHHVSKKQ